MNIPHPLQNPGWLSFTWILRQRTSSWRPTALTIQDIQNQFSLTLVFRNRALLMSSMVWSQVTLSIATRDLLEQTVGILR